MIHMVFIQNTYNVSRDKACLYFSYWDNKIHSWGSTGLTCFFKKKNQLPYLSIYITWRKFTIAWRSESKLPGNRDNQFIFLSQLWNGLNQQGCLSSGLAQDGISAKGFVLLALTKKIYTLYKTLSSDNLNLSLLQLNVFGIHYSPSFNIAEFKKFHCQY